MNEHYSTEHEEHRYNTSTTTTGTIVECVCQVPDCGESFPTKKELIKHHGVKHEEFTCDKCSKTIVGVHKYKWHQKICGVQFACDYPACGQLFNTKTERRVHQRTAHENPDLKQPCPHCQKLFTKKSLTSHIYKMHKELICKLCGKKTEGFKEMQKHRKEEHPQSP
ncbi:gastrula zinc finger protein xFG20-1-like protein [Leptotrombidium deliense]|uniref:Gastrula zinc finger protein xFG20-1-like protein n=1 Tax=Leptotrombidium deliense TaxID=299467 RepID=A0A443S5T1_9ACAR|nr:gastrula zinc finger protein xFG20-1-like protein [Leptotrombidium deliense]